MVRILENIALDFDDVLLKPKRSTLSSRKDVILDREFFFYHSPRRWTGVPLVISNMSGVGCFRFAKELSQYKVITCLHKHYKAEELRTFFEDFVIPNNYLNYVWISIGNKTEDYNRLVQLACDIGEQPNILINVANGHNTSFVNTCKKVRKAFNQSIIMAGSIGCPNMATELILSGGVDIVQGGIGSSKVCRTRTKSGVGVPQISLILECSEVVHGLKNGERKLGLFCSDGGVNYECDFIKGFSAGADFSMAGSYWSGTDLCEAEWEYEVDQSKVPYADKSGVKWPLTDKKKSMVFYGMSSKYAQNKLNGGMEDYKTSEGIVVRIPYKGKTVDKLKDVLGGLRSACTYVGSTDLRSLSKCSTFIRVNRTYDNRLEHLKITD